MTPCRWDADAGDYLTGDGDPCRRDDYGDVTRHCTARRTCSLHVGPGELTCARCLGRVRVTIRRIVERAALMPVQAENLGRPDSDAVSLAGPAADPEAWSWRKVAARQGRAWHVSLVEEDDELHPESLLQRWQWLISEDYGHERVEGIGEAAAYLNRHLNRIAQDPEQDFPLLRRETRACLNHLESAIGNSHAPERGAPCPDCRREKGQLNRLVRKYSHWCEDPDCERFHVVTDELDVWRCPRNAEHWWNPAGYANLIEERRYA